MVWLDNISPEEMSSLKKISDARGLAEVLGDIQQLAGGLSVSIMMSVSDIMMTALVTGYVLKVKLSSTFIYFTKV